MTNIIISPWSRNAPNGQECAKNYPFWPQVTELLRRKNITTIQIGVGNEKGIGADSSAFDLPLKDLVDLLKSCETWISVDNFFHHFAHFYRKPGVVIFGKSDPAIFGYKENKNLLKDEKYLRNNQYLWWNDEKLDENSFVSPEIVVNNVMELI